MIDPRLLIIRRWLASFAALAVLVLRPELGLYLFASFAWVPLGLFMPPLFSNAQACERCSTGSGPNSWQVVISGIVANTGSFCPSDCSTMDGTYSVPFINVDGLCCNWYYSSAANPQSPFPVCPAGPFGAYIYFDLAVIVHAAGTANHTYIRVYIGDGVGHTCPAGGYLNWEKDYSGSEPDCESLSSVDIPFLAFDGGHCDNTSATCTLSAL